MEAQESWWWVIVWAKACAPGEPVWVLAQVWRPKNQEHWWRKPQSRGKRRPRATFKEASRERESPFLHFLVLFRTSVAWMMPSHIGQGNLLNSVYRFKHSPHRKTPAQTHPEIMCNHIDQSAGHGVFSHHSCQPRFPPRAPAPVLPFASNAFPMIAWLVPSCYSWESPSPEGSFPSHPKWSSHPSVTRLF